MPAIEVYPRLSSGGYFSSRDFAGMILDELHVPNLRWLGKSPDPWIVELKRSIDAKRLDWGRLKNRQTTEAQCWDSIELTFPARGCHHLFIEQITTLMATRKNKKPSEHVLNLLNFAERCEIMITVTGVHHAQDMWRNFHELRRRVTPIWVRNYGTHHEGDEKTFVRILKAMSQSLRLSTPGLLADMAPELLVASGGTLGGLEKVLRKASDIADLAGKETIAKAHLERAFPNSEDIRLMWEDNENFRIAAASGSDKERVDIVRCAWAKRRQSSR
jgi:hypothetical protein